MRTRKSTVIFQRPFTLNGDTGELPPGGVLVVGSGASGFQIAEDLHQHGRKVYVCMGRHRRLARRYRGRDYARWAFELGLFERRGAGAPATTAPGPVFYGVKCGEEADRRGLVMRASFTWRSSVMA